MRQIIFLSVLVLAVYDASALLDSAEQLIIDSCLERFGGLTIENAHRLERFQQWSDTYEEIPCFTQCYLSKSYSFYNETTGFNTHRAKAEFGEPLYNACKEHFEQPQESSNTCQLAFQALHCITRVQNDPLILIESIKNITTEAKSAMKQCLVQFDESKWPRVAEFSAFPVIEPLPCFTQCFIGKLNIFVEKTRRWDLPAMRRLLGLPDEDAPIGTCRSRRGRNRCSTVYKQFTCFVLAKK